MPSAPAARPALSSAAAIAASTSRGRRPGPATHAGDDHGLAQTHCVTGIAGRQPVMPPTGSARDSAMRTSSPPSAAWRAISSASVSSVTALATRRPPERSAATTASRTPGRPPRRRRRSRPAAAVRRALPAPRLRRPQARARRTPRRCGECAPRDPALASIASARSRRIGQQPFDRDRTGAGADVPQQFIAPRRQRRQRHRADLALGDLAVMLEQSIGQA